MTISLLSAEKPKQGDIISLEKPNWGNKAVKIASDLYDDISVRVAGVIKPLIYAGGAIAKLAILAAIKLPLAFIATPIATMASIYVDNQREKLQPDLENIKKHEETTTKFIKENDYEIETNQLQTDIINFTTRLDEKKIKLHALKSEIEENVRVKNTLETHRDEIKKRESRFKEEIQGTDFGTEFRHYEQPSIRGAKHGLKNTLQKKYPIEFARASDISRTKSDLGKITIKLNELERKNSELTKNLKKIENEIASNEAHLVHFKNNLNSRLKTREPFESTSKKLSEIQKNTISNIKNAQFLIKSLTPNTFSGLGTDLEMISSYFGGQTANALMETVSGTANKKPISALDAFSDTLSILAGDYHDIEISPERDARIKSVYKTDAARQDALAAERISTWEKERGVVDNEHAELVTKRKEELAEKFTEQELKILSSPRIPASKINTERLQLQLVFAQLEVDFQNLYKTDKVKFDSRLRNLDERMTGIIAEIKKLDEFAKFQDATFEKYRKFSIDREFEEKTEKTNAIIREFPNVIDKFSKEEQRLLHLAKNTLPVEERIEKMWGR